MNSFLKMMLATIEGLVVFLFVVCPLFILMMVAIFSGGDSSSSSRIEANSILKIDISDAYGDRSSEEFSFMYSTEKVIGIDCVLKAIQNAKDNNNVKGIYITGDYTSGGANLTAIRRALIDFKESGKFIYAYSDNFSQSAYYLASTADKVIINPLGSIALSGASTTIGFMKNLFEKLGVEWQVFKVGKFKSAVEPFISTEMSDANRQQINSYLSSIWNYLLDGISENRNIAKDSLNTFADNLIEYSKPERFIESGLVDSLMYVEEAREFFKRAMSVEDFEDIHFVSVEELANASSSDTFAEEQIAVLYAAGDIVSGGSDSPFSEEMISDGVYVEEIRKLKEDTDVKAVVLRINSGGGSAYASEQIWHALEELKKEKPLIVSMGDYAASGGYYIACGADEIYADPITLTGSIGVFGLIPVMKKLYNNVGISFDAVKTNRNSDMGVINPFTQEQAELLQSSVNRTYDLFLTRVAEGRKMTKEAVDSIGQGRVWTGTQALEIGLVDKLGTLNDAIAAAAERAGITKYDVTEYPELKSPYDRLLDDFANLNIKHTLIALIFGEDFAREYALSKNELKFSLPKDYIQARIPKNSLPQF